MKIAEIKSIVELMSDNDLIEFKIESEDMQLCIKRGATTPQTQTVITSGAHAPVMQAAPAVAVPAAGTPAAAEEASVEDKITIDSPIVGTFYTASSPEAGPFVKVGDTVDEETVVCIVEAMKVMNEVKAEKSGVIKEILVTDASPVEFGQALFVIE